MTAFPPLQDRDFEWPQLAAMPIRECGEPLCRLEAAPRLRLNPAYYRQGINTSPDILLRRSLCERLHTALDLLPPQYGLEILDGYRSIETQTALRESFRRIIVAENPHFDEAAVIETLNQFVADPERPGMTPPHHTGGSVDLTLFDTADGRCLDMGTAFDEPSPLSHTAALENRPDSPARLHRRILTAVMRQAGFTNLPTEWWHFDYGNQNWAFFSGQSHAVYAAAQHIAAI